jgi:uncharacterized protein
MGIIIDRRPNQGQKHVGNRQRFITRSKQHIRDSIKRNLQNRSITDTQSGDKVKIPTGSINEPHFGHDPQSGINHRVLPGNKQYVTGDQIKRPPGGGDQGAGDPGDSTETGEDDFHFVLTKEEFQDLFFEDLELPDMVKKQLKTTQAYVYRRDGISTAGNPTNLNVIRTLKQSMGRRIVLRKPLERELAQLHATLAELPEDHADRVGIQLEIDALTRKIAGVCYVDPIDLRYNVFNKKPVPQTHATMFCIMDVSGSMDENKKDIAKRFFMLLYMFLQRKYERVHVEFIRHHTEADRVDEQTFFYDKLTGGTQVSSALTLLKDLIHTEFSPDQTNIYVCQVSDGDNYDSDNKTCAQLLQQELLSHIQYMAYVEVQDKEGWDQYPMLQYVNTKLFNTYKQVSDANARLQCVKVAEVNEIYPVFRELFEKK